MARETKANKDFSPRTIDTARWAREQIKRQIGTSHNFHAPAAQRVPFNSRQAVVEVEGTIWENCNDILPFTRCHTNIFDPNRRRFRSDGLNGMITSSNRESCMTLQLNKQQMSQCQDSRTTDIGEERRKSDVCEESKRMAVVQAGSTCGHVRIAMRMNSPGRMATTALVKSIGMRLISSHRVSLRCIRRRPLHTDTCTHPQHTYHKHPPEALAHVQARTYGIPHSPHSKEVMYAPGSCKEDLANKESDHSTSPPSLFYFIHTLVIEL